MKTNKFGTVYFIGIGGIGMSALARYYQHQGAQVSGYDKTQSPLTLQMEAEGMRIHYAEDVEQIPAAVKAKQEGSLVIYTPAIPADHQELVYLQQQGHRLYKRSEVLGLITQQLHTIGVAGTHGKTSTSTMLAHLLTDAKVDTAAFLGGISVNYQSNLLLPEGTDEVKCVVEADEFDRSFHRLFPDEAIITSAGADHLDIYGTHEALLEAFSIYIDRLPENGRLVIHESIRSLADHRPDLKVIDYSLDRGAVHAQNVHVANGCFVFDYVADDLRIAGLILKVAGFHNVENMLAAITIALQNGVTPDQVKHGVESFSGVKRRFEYIVQQEQAVYIDDYAHHPEEIEAAIRSVRALFPERPLTVLFQPHLFSRTKDFMAEFAEALSKADKVYLLDIYPAREQPIEGVTSAAIKKMMKNCDCAILKKADCVPQIILDQPSLLMSLGAGDIDRLVLPIKAIFENELAK